MHIERRKAYIEFLDESMVRVTTLFKQKTFNIENLGSIDLIELKGNPNTSKFYALVRKSVYDPKKNKDYNPQANELHKYWLDVYAETGQRKIEKIGMLYPGQGFDKGNFEVSLKVDS